MTGHELLEGLSYVDERYIQEAETARLGAGVHWRQLLSVAACLCILLTGVFAFKLMQPKGAMESLTEAAAPPAATEAAAPMEAAPEQAVEGCPTEADQAAPETEEEYSAAAGELQHIPYATLRILSVEDDHWVAVVEEISDEPTPLEVGMQVTVIIEADETLKTDEDDEIRYGCLLPKEGLLAKIEDGAYDAGANILYVTGVTLEEPPEEGQQ